MQRSGGPLPAKDARSAMRAGLAESYARMAPRPQTWSLRPAPHPGPLSSGARGRCRSAAPHPPTAAKMDSGLRRNDAVDGTTTPLTNLRPNENIRRDPDLSAISRSRSRTAKVGTTFAGNAPAPRSNAASARLHPGAGSPHTVRQGLADATGLLRQGPGGRAPLLPFGTDDAATIRKTLSADQVRWAVASAAAHVLRDAWDRKPAVVHARFVLGRYPATRISPISLHQPFVATSRLAKGWAEDRHGERGRG
jgi:hypothetical protein